MPETKNKITGFKGNIYFFGEGSCEGNPEHKHVLGGKGSSLASMSKAGLPIPPGFTLSIACCKYYHENNEKWPEGLEEELKKYMSRLEKVTGKTFGKSKNPLLVSVRSGAAKSMPGMMDTILNCGLSPALEAEVSDKAQFWSVYAQFILQFAETVAKLPGAPFEELAKAKKGGKEPEKATALGYIELYEKQTGNKFPLDPWASLLQCVNAVFESWNNERAKIYRKAHGMESLEGTAVNIQQMFNSQVSGITFTANPVNPAANEIIIESTYGLGESIVSGNVTPDRFVLDRTTMKIKETTPGNKAYVVAGLGQSREFLDPHALSLTTEQVAELACISLKVEDYFGVAVDIEWGLENGKFSLLQSRSIKGLEAKKAVEKSRLEEIARIKELAKAKSKVWIVHNLAETLTTPTPMTWDIIKQFMTGNGGFGSMYKDFGYRPSQVVCEEGFLDLLCGRIYADSDRVADLFWKGFPFYYDHEEVLNDPLILQAAPKKFDAKKADQAFLLRLPGTVIAMLRSSRIMKKARLHAQEIFDKEILPVYVAYLKEKEAQDLKKLTTAEVVKELLDRNERIMTWFGKESLKPGFFGGSALAQLENILVQIMGTAEGQRYCQVLTSGLENDSTMEQNIMLYKVSKGEASLEDFLKKFGHRAVGEMELADPRWSEDADYLKQIIESQKANEGYSPEKMHQLGREKREAAMKGLQAALLPFGAASLREDIEEMAKEAQVLLPYREIGKHYLMQGYQQIRKVLLELGRRWKIGNDVFYLELKELAGFENNTEKLAEEIEKRKVRWEAYQQMDLPDIINSLKLDDLGLPRVFAAASEMNGVSLSGGVVVGTARIIYHPGEAKDLGDDCILVCPSTDPSWTALFITIKGLVVDRGGILSHGAITARDFGIPAVACSDATSIIKNGSRLQINGDSGHITIIKEEGNA